MSHDLLFWIGQSILLIFVFFAGVFIGLSNGIKLTDERGPQPQLPQEEK